MNFILIHNPVLEQGLEFRTELPKLFSSYSIMPATGFLVLSTKVPGTGYYQTQCSGVDDSLVSFSMVTLTCFLQHREKDLLPNLLNGCTVARRFVKCIPSVSMVVCLLLLRKKKKKKERKIRNHMGTI